MATASMDANRKRAVRRTTAWLTLLALAFYVGFILMGVLGAKA